MSRKIFFKNARIGEKEGFMSMTAREQSFPVLDKPLIGMARIRFKNTIMSLEPNWEWE